ncbi:MAG TPA: CoA-binding protein [Candidatus Sulfotelmatobacter sp.]|nr:CoA-binding protein [Candidatus Sulfotelmatobacter sp.]
MSSDLIRQILIDYKTIAVVGISKDSKRDSYQVSKYLKEVGYRMIPVNPTIDTVLGEKSYSSLLNIPVEIQKEIDIVDIFRRTEFIPPIVEQAVELRKKYGRPYVIWMQLGITNDKAAEVAKEAGLTVIMDKCIMQEHRLLLKKQ